MTVKQVLFGDEARERLLRGIEILSKAVKSTLGARGRTALMEYDGVAGSITSTKDGVTVARAISLKDSVEDMAVRVVREAAENTARQAGDGTTTSIVLAEAIINEAHNQIDVSKHNKTDVIRNIQSMVDEYVNILDERTKPVSDDNILNIATISSNNDPALGKLIADAYIEVGSSGLVVVERGEDEVEVNYNGGIKFNRGIISEYQLTNHKKREIELEDVYILMSDRKLENLLQINQELLKQIFNNGSSLLIIAELGDDAQASLNENVYKRKIKAANVIPPNNGYRMREMMTDIADVTGGKFISQQTGSDWSLVTMEDLGYAKKVLIDKFSTTIIDDEIMLSEPFLAKIGDLTSSIEETDSKQDKEDFENRIAVLSGKVATISIGGRTDLEKKELFDRADDAVRATKAAIDGGILPGGGLSLLRIATGPSTCDHKNVNEVVAESILFNAMAVPFNQILINAGVDPSDIINDIDPDKNIGYDVKDMRIVNMYEAGIIDPAKVTKCAIQNAVAVASTILSTETVVTNLRNSDVQ